MFESMEALSSKLALARYFIDPVMTQVAFLAAKLQKPLLLEGPAGSGKTQLAISVAGCSGHARRAATVLPKGGGESSYQRDGKNLSSTKLLVLQGLSPVMGEWEEHFSQLT